MTQSDLDDQISRDQFLLLGNQEPILRPVTLNEALARALKYNFDQRLKAMEVALASGLSSLSNYDMLPSLVASAGYANRNNYSGGTSISLLTGRPSLEPSTGQERERTLAGVEFSWNVLDFGLSYYTANQRADEYLVTEERRRRVAQNIAQDVRNAYWRALGAQRLAARADALLERVRAALYKSREAEAQGLLPPAQALAYQRALLDAMSLLTVRRQELVFAKKELAALMNAAPGQSFDLADDKEEALPTAPANVVELEYTALYNRPELREENYRRRISVAETRKALLSLLPNLSLNIFGQHDSNSLLFNSNWIDGGLRVAMNLMRLAALPATQAVNEARVQLDDTRRMAVSVAVMTQVRVSLERYRIALLDFELAEETNRVDQRMARYAEAAVQARADSELEYIRNEARALLSEYQRYASYANAQNSLGRIYNSLGLDVIPEQFGKQDLASLTATVGTLMGELRRTTFGDFGAAAAATPQLALDIVGVPAGSRAQRVRAAVEGALKRNGVELAPAGTRSWRLTLALRVGEPEQGLTRGEWTLVLAAPDGRVAREIRYGTVLQTQGTDSVVAAFAEAAVVANLRTLLSIMSGREDPLALVKTSELGTLAPADAEPAADAAQAPAAGEAGGRVQLSLADTLAQLLHDPE